MNELADRMEKNGTFTPDEAQNAIAAYNSVVDWSKSTPEIAANAMVEKSIARQLNELMDNAIMADENPGYRTDRAKYGRLAQMEKEAAHRARVAGRAAPSSLFDGVVGALSSGELVSGILSLNPAMAAKGGAMMAFKNIRNRLNSPDYQIKRMYKVADKSFQERLVPETPQTYPRQQKTVYDPSTGRRIPADQGNKPRTPANLPTGPETVYDSSIGRRIPVNQDLPTRKLSDLTVGPQTYFDPTVGARTLRKP
jgi:hypothetical protein